MTNSIDRLYELLPAIHRIREAERADRLNLGEKGYYLRDLLRVITEQVDAVEENITQLYDDWFIETASDWAVPYIAELIGYEPVQSAGDPVSSRSEENRILIPRRDVAGTIEFRGRRGTLSVLQDLALAVSGWPTLAVEFFKLLGWTQNLNHQHANGFRARVATLRDANALDQIGGPFDPFAHTVNVRRISSTVSQGRHNIPSVGLFVWRLKPYSVTKTPANCLDAGRNAYTFSVLGNDAPLFTKPSAGAAELQVPTPIRRRALDQNEDAYYGEGKSFAIWADWAGHTLSAPIPHSAIQVADLTDWVYAPPDDSIAVDPKLGRIAFPVNQLPRRHVRVSYHYGFSADMGGGEYSRDVSQPAQAQVFTVGESGEHKRIGDALAEWRRTKPKDAVLEITDSSAYVEQINIVLEAGQSLQLRAANRTRPVIRLLDWQTDLPDALSVRMASGSRFTLDGLLVTGRGVAITSQDAATPRTTRDRKLQNRYENPRDRFCDSEVVIRHCTLVPGWSLDSKCRPVSPNKESLELRNVRARVRISRTIMGPIEVQEDEVQTDPIPIEITDSIIDAMDGDREAIIGPAQRHAHAVLTVKRSTVFGIVQVYAIQLGENSIFNDCVHVGRRHIGCLRFCYVPPHCRTPRRYHCQPDLAIAAARERNAGESPIELAAAEERESLRVRPQFTSRRYGTPAYCQLSEHCAEEIVRGADDSSEMGVFHDLFQPQRMANLRARLDQFTPAGMTAGVIVAS